MTPDTAPPRRTLNGLAPHRTVTPDLSVSRLRRDHRTDSPTQQHELSTQHETIVPEEATDTPQAPAAGAGLPKYLQLIRKEARLRQDQADRLEQETRRLNRTRQHRHGAVGERITSNTLIRVAVDMLLCSSTDLVGTTEEELTRSALSGLLPPAPQPTPVTAPTGAGSHDTAGSGAKSGVGAVSRS